MPTALYDTIGRGYRIKRIPDPRIGSVIGESLEGMRSIVNVGAGAGSYEPRNLPLLAIEPSIEMIRQRPKGSAPVVRGVAEALPLSDRSFDAAMGALTVHHWAGRIRGLREMARVARLRVVIFTFLPGIQPYWLTEDYFPEIARIDAAILPPLTEYEEGLGTTHLRVVSVPIPHDCQDGFLCAYWRRPEAYLDAGVRRSISSFSKIGDHSEGLNRLAEDLKSGRWDAKYGHLRKEESLDPGYRLIIADVA